MAALRPALAVDGSSGGRDDLHSLPPQPQTQPALQFGAGTIILSRPLHELWAHVTHCELPSTLLARHCELPSTLLDRALINTVKKQMATLALDRSFDGRDGLHSLPPQLQTQPALRFDEGKIILSRPLHELWAHVTHCQLPSWTLLMRAICTLFMAIFRWHFCDGILLLRGEGLYHSFNGQIEMIAARGVRIDRVSDFPIPFFNPEDLTAFEACYPHLLESGRWLKKQRGHILGNTDEPRNPQWQYITLSADKVVAVPDFTRAGYTELTAQTVRKYFYDFYNVNITEQTEGNTLATLVYSDKLRLTRVHIPR